MGKSYKIIDGFSMRGYSVLVLDRPYDFDQYDQVIIDGEKVNYSLNSIPTWVIIKGINVPIGKSLTFV